jgi:hypothetical protein
MKAPKLFRILTVGAAIVMLSVFNHSATAQDYWGYSTGDPQPDPQPAQVITGDTSTLTDTIYVNDPMSDAGDTLSSDSAAYDYTINNYYYADYYGDNGFGQPAYPQLFVGYDYCNYSAPWYYGGWYPTFGWDYGHVYYRYAWETGWNAGWNDRYHNDRDFHGEYAGWDDNGYPYDGGYGHNDGSNNDNAVNKVRGIGATRGFGDPNGNIVNVPRHGTQVQINPEETNSILAKGGLAVMPQSDPAAQAKSVNTSVKTNGSTNEYAWNTGVTAQQTQTAPRNSGQNIGAIERTQPSQPATHVTQSSGNNYSGFSRETSAAPQQNNVVRVVTPQPQTNYARQQPSFAVSRAPESTPGFQPHSAPSVSHESATHESAPQSFGRSTR